MRWVQCLKISTALVPKTRSYLLLLTEYFTQGKPWSESLEYLSFYFDGWCGLQWLSFSFSVPTDCLWIRFHRHLRFLPAFPVLVLHVDARYTLVRPNKKALQLCKNGLVDHLVMVGPSFLPSICVYCTGVYAAAEKPLQWRNPEVHQFNKFVPSAPQCVILYASQVQQQRSPLVRKMCLVLSDELSPIKKDIWLALVKQFLIWQRLLCLLSDQKRWKFSHLIL